MVGRRRRRRGFIWGRTAGKREKPVHAHTTKPSSASASRRTDWLQERERRRRRRRRWWW